VDVAIETLALGFETSQYALGDLDGSIPEPSR